MTSTQTRVATALILLAVFLPLYWFLPAWGLLIMFSILGVMLCEESMRMLNIRYSIIWAVISLPTLLVVYYWFEVFVYATMITWLFRSVWMLFNRKINELDSL